MNFFRITYTCVFAIVAFSGCATFSKDGGLGGVKDATSTHIKQEIVWPKSAAEEKAVADARKAAAAQRIRYTRTL